MAVFSLEDVRKETLQYFRGDEIATDVWMEKYALKNSSGEFLEKSPDDMHRRLAREFSRIEKKYPNPMTEDEIYELLKDFKYVVPQGSPMSAVGNPFKVQSMSNCFVIPSPMDSYGSIARADEQILQIQKRRGGVGVDLSEIRPRSLGVANAAGSSDGIGIFMERYSNTTREVAQGGRRGALMETIDVRHPDIETFITIKQDLKKVTGANVSVRVTDEFMKAVESDNDFHLRWPVQADPVSSTMTKSVKATYLWNLMMTAAWKSAEPGILYWDTVKRYSMADEYADKGFETICTNPCSELPLSAYDSCRLLLLNLFSYVKDPFTKFAKFDEELFEDHCKKAQRLMDDLVDLEIEAIDKIIEKVQKDPEPESEKIRELSLWKEVRKACSDGRRTGTGITALGDALAALGVKYGSPKSISLTEKMYKNLALSAHASSVQMAFERGPFPAWESDRYQSNKFSDLLMKNSDQDVNEKFFNFGRRNIALTTTAPAGSVSILTQTTSGIEPPYLLHYKRRKKVTDNEITNGARVDFVDDLGDRWQEYDVFHPGVKRWMEVTGETDSKSIENSPYFGATSNDIDWVASVDLLAAAQKWTEHSISKTINLPSSATVELVSEVYMRAWKAGIKGVTVYRDGSRSGVLVSAEEKEKDSPKDENGQPRQIVESHAPKRPKDLPCEIHRAKVHGEDWTIIVGLFAGRPFEIFGGLSKFIEIPKKKKQGRLVKNGKVNGISTYNVSIPIGEDDEILIKDIVSTFDNPMFGSFTRMISLSLRHGIPVSYVVEQLQKQESEDMQSFSKVIARVLKQYIVDGTKLSKKCPECSVGDMSYQEGCMLCTNCGWSKCG